jgi:hypothetical protein
LWHGSPFEAGHSVDHRAGILDAAILLASAGLIVSWLL